MLHFWGGIDCVSRTAGFLGVACILMFVVGCGEAGPTVVPVTGKVVRDGKALTNVSATFLPKGSGLSATGSSDSSGKIIMLTNGRSGAKVGQYRVGITEPLRDMTPEAIASGSPPPTSFDPKFQSPDTSGIEFTVPEKGGTFEFEVFNKKK